MRRFLSVISIVALTIVGALPAGAQEGDGPIHLGVGDSVAYGFGVKRPDQHGYMAVLSRWAHSVDCRDGEAAACPHLELVNMSVPGATSSTLMSEQLPGALALISQRNGDDDPGNDVEIITLDIGGNDLFNPVINACAGGVTPECVDVVTNGMTTFAANLGVILGSLRSAAGPDTRIVIMTYYNPLGACFLSDLAPLADLVLEGGGPLPLGLNDVIRSTAAATGVEVAETYGKLDNDDFVGGQDCLHPDKSGYHEIARAFDEILG